MSTIKDQFQKATNYIKSKFQNPEQNLEIQIVLEQINLLHQYINTPAKSKKSKIYKQLNQTTKTLLSKGYKPQELIIRFEKVIKLDIYRPKNLSLFQLATSDDLDNIGGEFDTFDATLSQLSKDTKNNADKIRNRFDSATANRFILSQQFAQDWIRRLKKHPSLVYAAKNATEDKMLYAYKSLFLALRKDFCKEYQIPLKQVDIIVVQNLSELDKYGAITTTKHVSDQSKKSSDGYDKTVVILILTKILHKAKTDGIEPFVFMCAVFAHEMGHVLDRLNPRKGALGTQVNRIDRETYVKADENTTEYYKSATELSSYQIESKLVKQLKDFCRE